MTQSVRDVLRSLDESVPPSKAAGWDPVGLQVGDPAARVEKVGVVHEVNEAVLALLTDAAVDLVITYHPLLFSEVRSFVAGRSPAGRAYRLARIGTALAAVHTAFDVAPGGTADALATDLGLTGTEGFGPLWSGPTAKVVVFVPEADADELAAAMSAAGAGEIGAYTGCSYRSEGTGTFLAPEGAAPATGVAGRFNREPETRLEMLAPSSRLEAVVTALAEAHPYEEPAYDIIETRSNPGFVGRLGRLESATSLGALARLVSERLDAPVRVAGDRDADMAVVAVVPGSGGSFLSQAAGRADVLITGDVSHHTAVEALDRGLAVIDAGHAATERPGLRALYALVERLGVEAIDMTTIDADPWKEG